MAENFEERRDATRSGGDGVDTYSEPSITVGNKVFTKIIETKYGRLMRRILGSDEESRARGATV